MAKPYIARYTPRFLQEFENFKAQNQDIGELVKLMDMLIRKKRIPARYRDHELRKRYAGFRDAHVDDEKDWILIYRYIGNNSISFERIGSHPDIFDNEE
jgi:mRNA interferase YafQ